MLKNKAPTLQTPKHKCNFTSVSTLLEILLACKELAGLDSQGTTATSIALSMATDFGGANHRDKVSKHKTSFEKAGFFLVSESLGASTLDIYCPVA